MKYIILLFPLLLVGCASTPVVLRPTLPSSITEPCIVPEATLKTNKDLLFYALDLKGDLQTCSIKQRALAESLSKEK